MESKNPHNICTWGDSADCTGCSINGELHCKWDRRVLYGFYAANFPLLIMAIFGMVVVGILTRLWWPLIAYGIYVPLMLGFLETGFLCRHCPYYAEDSKILHCLANHGDPKIWAYQPKPMNTIEKFMMIFLVVGMIFVFSPLAVEAYGIWYVAANYAEYGLIALLGLVGILVASLSTGIAAIIILKTFFCNSCVNFSCPLNTVPKAIIDEYLKKNNVMRKAWEESGWSIE